MGKLLKVSLVGFVLAIAGCGGEAPAAPSGNEAPAAPSGGDVGSDQQKSQTCECSAYWYCPTDGMEFWYDPPGCGFVTYTTAHNQCEFHCPAACINAGWQC
ncbi:MAG TPA: hypothetical protein VK550_23495 [Polyangiaceae bacterium]|nr:hypothetical protein [Polyangiaceae bacterium]